MANDEAKKASNEDQSEKDDIRNAIRDMLSGNLKNLPSWLEGIGESNPEKALSIFKDFAEYVLPKQQRTDSKDSAKAPFTIVFEPSSKANIKVSAPSSDILIQPQKVVPHKKSVIDDLLP